MSRRPNPALDLRHPFFRPVWRRVVLVSVLVFWTVIEITQGNPFWAVLVGGICAYASYVFFLAFELDDEGS